MSRPSKPMPPLVKKRTRAFPGWPLPPLPPLPPRVAAPDWYFAPKWARARTQDADGTWRWWEWSPMEHNDRWSLYVGRNLVAGHGFPNPNWRAELQHRPEPAGSHSTNPFDTPATWHCAYCDRENHGDRLTCVGCQAGRSVRPLRVARVRETTYRGIPLSKLSEVELRAAVKYMTSEMHTSPADFNTIADRWEALYGGPLKWGEVAILDSGVVPTIERWPRPEPALRPFNEGAGCYQPRPAILPTDTFGAERTGSILQRLRKMVGLR